MKRLLSIEFQKIWKNKASRVLLLTYFVLLSFIALIASIKFSIGTFEIRIADQGIFNFPYIWHFNTYVAAFFKIFLAIVIVSMMANEYTYGTLKQNLIDGLSKKEFILSKFLVVASFAIASTVFVFIMSLILGYSFSSYNELSIVFTDLEYLLAFFIKLFAFFSFCLFLGILVKRSAFALGFLFVWFVAENIIYWIIKFVILGGDDKHKNFGDTIIQFFPIEAMSNLVKEPITRLSAIKTIENAVGGAQAAKDYSIHFSQISIVLVWTFIFILTSYYILKKRDL
ncbi:ABC-type transport system involved in multi-copper enzyme maturation permease subunit [Flavobacterium aquaticum]|uniref:ABC-type transport system involved in multi-copper enzyme maturation permease subunit n=1 Tax=Flavobacterium aquaticum TaxID=1236486 RepID=A0A327YPT8_9FLAO|nr:ABC transporter permease [Flavobacterium aquaticum]RAK22572.1 ABC-type transport system involved in multi-copper enzyme maturation permease subunit [Flavobacterium aquaticum]